RKAHPSLGLRSRRPLLAPLNCPIATESPSAERIHDPLRELRRSSRVLRTCLETCAAAFSRKRPGHARRPPGRCVLLALVGTPSRGSHAPAPSFRRRPTLTPPTRIASRCRPDQ